MLDQREEGGLMSCSSIQKKLLGRALPLPHHVSAEPLTPST